MLPIIPGPFLNQPGKAAGQVPKEKSETDFAAVLETETSTQNPESPMPATVEEQDSQPDVQSEQADLREAAMTTTDAVPDTPQFTATNYSGQPLPFSPSVEPGTAGSPRQSFSKEADSAALNMTNSRSGDSTSLVATNLNNRPDPLGPSGAASTLIPIPQDLNAEMNSATSNNAQFNKTAPRPADNSRLQASLAPPEAADNSVRLQQQGFNADQGSSVLNDSRSSKTADSETNITGKPKEYGLDMPLPGKGLNSRPVLGTTPETAARANQREAGSVSQGSILSGNNAQLPITARNNQLSPLFQHQGFSGDNTLTANTRKLPGKIRSRLSAPLTASTPQTESHYHLRNQPNSGFNQVSVENLTPEPPSTVTQSQTAANQGTLQSALFNLASHSTPEKMHEPIAQDFSSALPGAGITLSSVNRAPLDSNPILPQPATMINVPDSQIVDQVVNRLTLSKSDGETNLSLTLHPQELGEVRIELVSDKEGVRVHLLSQHQSVQDALERHLPRLREAFESQGLKIHDLQISSDSHRGGGPDSQQEQRLPYRLQSKFSSTGAADEAKQDWPAESLLGEMNLSNIQGLSLHI